MVTQNAGTAIENSTAWRDENKQLAEWTMAHFVNRTDRHGCYGVAGPFTAGELVRVRK